MILLQGPGREAVLGLTHTVLSESLHSCLGKGERPPGLAVLVAVLAYRMPYRY